MMLYNYCYGYSLLSYMEYPVLLIQEYILILLVLKYQRQLNQMTYTIAGGYIFVVLLFGYQILPKFLLALLVVSEPFPLSEVEPCTWFDWIWTFSQPFCTPIGATSKIIQLYEILRSRDSTTVSLTTWFLSAFTNLSKFGAVRFLLMSQFTEIISICFRTISSHLYGLGWVRRYDAVDQLHHFIWIEQRRAVGRVLLQTQSTDIVLSAETGSRDNENLSIEELRQSRVLIWTDKPSQ